MNVELPMHVMRVGDHLIYGLCMLLYYVFYSFLVLAGASWGCKDIDDASS